MANFTQTITNSMTLLGAGPPSLWGTMVWGTGRWGEEFDLPHAVMKQIDNSVATSPVIINDVTRTYDNSIPITDDLSKSTTRELSESIAVTSVIPDQFLTDPAGYNYVFPGETVDAYERDLATWSDVSQTAASFTSASQPSTSWSEV